MARKSKVAASTVDEAQAAAPEPEAEEAAVEFAGQHKVSEHFVIHASERLGLKVLEIKPTGWVGPGFEVLASRVDELIDLLGEIEGLPEQQ